MTTHSFSSVIKEFEGDLARVPLLRNFDVHTLTQGLSFTGSGPSEKDRQLLVECPIVVEELLRLPAACRAAIGACPRAFIPGDQDRCSMYKYFHIGEGQSPASC
ncbi:hypothetical protein DFH09DRAFT_1073233 [Mycena vulgaris]|nr:hypothetical protein DFH09DRAFT_1073233 [Mycena vulgaris]